MPKSAYDCPLTVKQEAAALALLKPFHGTQAQVAKAVGVSERTLKYWLKLPQFQERLAEGRAALWKETLDNLTGSMNWASNVLAGLLKSNSETIRLRAASVVVYSSLRAHETLDLEARLTALETELARRKIKGGI